MSGLLLTQEESDRFAGWLEREADSDRVILRQIEALGPGHAAMVQKLRVGIAALLIVAVKLRGIERVTLGEEDR